MDTGLPREWSRTHQGLESGAKRAAGGAGMSVPVPSVIHDLAGESVLEGIISWF